MGARGLEPLTSTVSIWFGTLATVVDDSQWASISGATVVPLGRATHVGSARNLDVCTKDLPLPTQRFDLGVTVLMRITGVFAGDGGFRVRARMHVRGTHPLSRITRSLKDNVSSKRGAP